MSHTYCQTHGSQYLEPLRGNPMCYAQPELVGVCVEFIISKVDNWILDTDHDQLCE